MTVIFVSECEKKALKRTRRVLDSFAERIGHRTWRAIITKAGLDAVRSLLCRSATKSTAVSCHWIRSRTRSDLLWIVGNRDKFDEQGIVPVHYTRSDILSLYKENDWRELSLIKALVAVAALLHDWGKANEMFQKKLETGARSSDPLRHEWISALLFGAFVSIDTDTWMERMASGAIDEKAIERKLQDFSFQSFAKLSLTVQVITWLVVTHHKLPSFSRSAQQIKAEFVGEEMMEFEEFFAYVDENWGYAHDGKSVSLRFRRSLALSDRWQKELKRWVGRLQDAQERIEELYRNGALRVILHHARLAVMLGDYSYSSKEADARWQSECTLYANTDKEGSLKQKLDEHLVGVCKEALGIVQRLPVVEEALPKAHNIRTLRRPSPKGYEWQDKARKAVYEHYATLNHKEGFFAVNMASTGTGKTIANAKIMQSLNRERSMRCILALGLRTLTLQTGDEYRKKIGLGDEEMAILIGSRAVAELHNTSVCGEEDTTYRDFETSGSESAVPIFDGYLDFGGGESFDALHAIVRKTKEARLLEAPVVVMTIDHIMGAVDTPKGGGYLLPALRLLGSDLVIDEIDDFGIGDLIAIGRLVHLAGMLGLRVMISSATISPDLAEGYFHAYREGWRLYAATRDAADAIHTFWIDEFRTSSERIAGDERALMRYKEAHRTFVRKRVANLQKMPPLRKATISDLPVNDKLSRQEYFSHIADTVLGLHDRHHSVDPVSGKRVSFGVVRVANIPPCIDLARYLASFEGSHEIKVMAYHSNQILLMRHVQEHHLDEVLKRKEKEGEMPKAFENPIVRRHIDVSKSDDLLFVLVATPVEEVGRDHDFDWAVIEPSSWRSVIQMAGRVMRHRKLEPGVPNVAIMRYNLKAYLDGDREKAYFIHPGFEDGILLQTHDMCRLVDTAVIRQRLDATWRIQKSDPLECTKCLPDLEHCAIAEALNHDGSRGPESMNGWLTGWWFLTALPLFIHAFRAGLPSLTCWLVYDEKRDRYYFAQKDDEGNFVDREAILGIEKEKEVISESNLWMERSYERIVEDEAVKRGVSKEEITMRFGELSFVRYDNTRTYLYSDQWGLTTNERIDL